jgi:hypothetical protein
MHIQLLSEVREYVTVRVVMLLGLPNGDFHQQPEHLHNQWFEVLCYEQVQYYDNRAKKAQTPFK